MVNQYTVKRPVAVCYCGEHAWLNLTRGYVTFIEPADAKFVGQWSWSALYRNGRDPRAVRRENADGKMRYLHRELVPSKIVDHKDGNTLNNRRSNLRPCSQLENNWNAKPRSGKSKFKGVSLCRKTGAVDR